MFDHLAYWIFEAFRIDAWPPRGVEQLGLKRFQRKPSHRLNHPEKAKRQTEQCECRRTLLRHHSEIVGIESLMTQLCITNAFEEQ